MKVSNKRDALANARYLNKLLGGGAAILLCLTLTLTIALVLVAYNQPRTLVPPNLTTEINVSNTSVSDSYLQQMAEYVLFLKLNVTPENVGRNYGQLLQYVDSRSYHIIQPKLLAEAKDIRSEKISSTFFPKNTAIAGDDFQVRISGLLTKYVGNRPLEPEPTTYIVQFTYPSGMLALDSISKVEIKKD
ncbi:conjugal transfer protein TraE [Shewanella sairae]|uniref:Conjugal transfer protein TraE n=1 Tax=Shewanella sairae TaxID=190310 RepID=A0ABQ4PS57_9GAMM|nr:type IV conjugative transfer system protein TraE [Shewanella sairae]MCL1132650.1 type IV conjugative transfer system protein TraE [Shewanella sairae]GIU52671.1 conjugal transfer protein TraE [Shewanella sairae]